MDNAKRVLPGTVEYVTEVIEAIKDTDIVFILTEWDEIKSMSLEIFKNEMKQVNIYDGRNCFSIEDAQNSDIRYRSIGRVLVDKNMYVFDLSYKNKISHLTNFSRKLSERGSALKICFAASSGGHLEQLMMLYPMMKKNESFILTEKQVISLTQKI